MSETKKHDTSKDVRDLSPKKDAKGGGRHGGLNTAGRGKHHQK